MADTNIVLSMFFVLDCSKNAPLTLSSSETQHHIDKHFKNDKFRIQCEFERAYKFLSNWSNIENNVPNNDSFKITLNIGDYRFEGCGRTLDEAKFDAIKKFYLSSVKNFFEINNQNETETVLGNTPSNDQRNSSHCADTKPSGIPIYLILLVWLSYMLTNFVN